MHYSIHSNEHFTFNLLRSAQICSIILQFLTIKLSASKTFHISCELFQQRLGRKNNWIQCVFLLFFDTRVECIKLAYFLYSLPIPFFVFPSLYIIIICIFLSHSFMYEYVLSRYFSIFTCCYPLVWLLNRVIEQSFFFCYLYYNISYHSSHFWFFYDFIFTDLFSAYHFSPSFVARCRH